MLVVTGALTGADVWQTKACRESTKVMIHLSHPVPLCLFVRPAHTHSPATSSRVTLMVCRLWFLPQEPRRQQDWCSALVIRSWIHSPDVSTALRFVESHISQSMAWNDARWFKTKNLYLSNYSYLELSVDLRTGNNSIALHLVCQKWASSGWSRL